MIIASQTLRDIANIVAILKRVRDEGLIQVQSDIEKNESDAYYRRTCMFEEVMSQGDRGHQVRNGRQLGKIDRDPVMVNTECAMVDQSCKLDTNACQ